jgi:hypothetical protein
MTAATSRRIASTPRRSWNSLSPSEAVCVSYSDVSIVKAIVPIAQFM